MLGTSVVALLATLAGCAAESSDDSTGFPVATGGTATGTGGLVTGTGGYGTGTGGVATGTGGVATGTGGVATGTGGVVSGAGGTTTTPVACTGAATLDGYLDNGTMCGYAWTGTFDGGTIDPPCGTAGPCFTGATLCASATIPAQTTVYPGVMIGWNVAQANGSTSKSTWASTGTGITANFTATGATGETRLVVKVGTTDYCAKATSGTAVPWSSFVTNCWEGGTPQTPLPAGAAIESISVQINSTTAAQTVTDFCLTSVTNN